MLIYFNGDSNTAGTELENTNDCFANQLANLLEADLFNDAYAGASNDRILKTTNDYINQHSPDLVIIGWSSSEREDWFINGEYKSVNSFRVNTNDLDQQSQWEYWANNKSGWLSGDYAYEKELCKYWNTKIFNFHLELSYKNIPHLFFNAIYSFNTRGSVYEYNWNNNFYGPYDKNLAMIQWADLAGYQQITPGKWHFKKDAHTNWANILYNHLINYDIVHKR